VRSNYFRLIHGIWKSLSTISFSNPPASHFQEAESDAGSFDQTLLEGLFVKYTDGENHVSDQMDTFLNDLGVGGGDIVSLILAWKLNAKTLGEFTKEEFIEGFSQLRCDSIEKIKERLPTLKESINEEQSFKEFYYFVFEYSKEEKANNIRCDIAIEMWPLLLKDRFKHLDVWLEYLKNLQNSKGLKGIGRDAWQLLLPFSKQVNADMSNFDSDGAWPLIIDEFVEYAKPKFQK